MGLKLPVVGNPIVSNDFHGDLRDQQERVIRYVRISLTDRCNYRCTYCMPAEGVALSPRQEVLTFEEIERIAKIFALLGVERLRLTGGEPTIRKHVTTLVRMLSSIEGINSVVMTSNGHRFPELAVELKEAGLDEVNISIDTLDPDRFRELTRRGDLTRVIAGIDSAIEAGLVVKLNAVALAGFSEKELANLCSFAWSRGIVVRFIEHMPMGEGIVYTEARHLSAAEIRRIIGDEFSGTVVPTPGWRPNDNNRGPTRMFQLADNPLHRFGIISAMSEHFCATCNRVRLSSTGDLHTCLGYDDATGLRELVRSGASDEQLIASIRGALALKRDGHRFEISGLGGPRKHMVSIGG